MKGTHARPAAAAATNGGPLLQVRDLHVVFPTPRGVVRAVSGVTFSIDRGQIYGIVGESGCGTSVTGRAILRLVTPPGRISGGSILFHDGDLLEKSEDEMRQLRGRKISMVFQDPAAALNPLFTVGQQITGIMKRHRVARGTDLCQRAIGSLSALGLGECEQLLNCYPHQLSGGMQQRVMIAIALCVEAELIIADEPTSSLDVTIQSQILDLLLKMQKERGVAIMLITHDLGVVAETCQRLAVFYLGRIVEEGDVRSIFHDTKHPYSQGLLAALPDPRNWGRSLRMIPGSIPSALAPVVGCAFASRCDRVMEICRKSEPALRPVGPDHQVACYLYEDRL